MIKLDLAKKKWKSSANRRRLSSTYRQASGDAVCVIAGMSPLDILTNEGQYLPRRRRVIPLRIVWKIRLRDVFNGPYNLVKQMLSPERELDFSKRHNSHDPKEAPVTGTSPKNASVP